MKITFTLLSLLFLQLGFGQSADDILGTWLTDEGKGKIKVYKKNGEYFGKIIWLNDDVGPNNKGPKLDVNNPVERLQSRKLVGTVVVKNLTWDAEEQEWNEGEIYDPESGNTYSVYAWMNEKDVLHIKGYIGFSLIGRATKWQRVD